MRRLERALGLPPDALVLAGQWERAPREIRGVVARMARDQVRFERVVRLVREKGLVDAYATGELAEALEGLVAEMRPARVGVAGGEAGVVPVVNRVRDGYPAHPLDAGGAGVEAEEVVVTPGAGHPRAVAIRVVGASMEPAYVQGDIAVCHPTERVRDGADCFVQWKSGGDAAVFLRVYSEGATVVRLQPLNTRFAPVIADRGDIARAYEAVRVVREVG